MRPDVGAAAGKQGRAVVVGCAGVETEASGEVEAGVDHEGSARQAVRGERRQRIGITESGPASGRDETWIHRQAYGIPAEHFLTRRAPCREARILKGAPD